MITLAEQLSGYKQFFSGFEEDLTGHVDEVTHKAVSYVIDLQFGKVKSPSCVKSIERNLDRLIRNARVEFECMYISLKDYYYPDFVLDIAETEVEGYLATYHSLVIDLLKTLIVAAEKRSSETESYDYVLAYDRRDLVPERQKKLFGEDDTHSEGHDSGTYELTSKQLDVNLREIFK